MQITRRGAAAFVAGLSALTFGACGGVSDYKAPSSFTVSDSSVSDVVTQAINNSGGSPGIKGTPTVDCAGERSCNIKYTVKEPAGIDNDVELIEPTRQIWKAMFEDASFRRGAIVVEGPVTSVGGKSSDAPLFGLSCDRAAADQIDWDNVDGKGMRTLCNYVPMVKGL